MRKAPQFIILTILAIFVLWGGYWLIGSRGTQTVLTQWFDDRQAEGWVAEFATLDTRGFPNRFDTTITDLNLSDPDTGVAWNAPEFQILSLSYRPTRVIAVFLDEQVFATRTGRTAIRAEVFRGSFSLTPTPSLSLEMGVLELEQATFTNQKDEENRLDRAQLAFRESPGGGENTYDIDLAITGLYPDGAFLARAAEAGALSEVVERVHLGATVTFDAPWDRSAIEVARPKPRTIDISALEADWGALSLTAEGTLDVDEAGIPQGALDVSARNWRDIIAVARNAGAIEPGFAAILAGAGEMLAQLSGDPDTLDATLTFRDGLVFLGPVNIGPAPVLHLP